MRNWEFAEKHGGSPARPLRQHDVLGQGTLGRRSASAIDTCVPSVSVRVPIPPSLLTRRSVVQGPAFFLTDETDAEISAAEAGFALTGLITCSVLFVGYLMYQVGKSGRRLSIGLLHALVVQK